MFCIHKILKKKWEYNEAVQQLFIDFEKAYDLVRREVLYNILIEFVIPTELVRLFKMCLTETNRNTILFADDGRGMKTNKKSVYLTHRYIPPSFFITVFIVYAHV
jgi:hypothetical protein